MNCSRCIYAICACSIYLTGCGKSPPANDCFVETTIKNRIDKEVYWNCNTSPIVQSILAEELTADTAIQIALLNNKSVQVTFEEIGIAQADLLEAGLLSNPIFDVALRFTNKSGYRTNTEFNITQNFIDILLVPLKKKMAAAELERVKLHVANILLNLSFDVENKYTQLVAAQKEKELLQDIIELAETANEIAIAQGNIASINRLDLQLRTADYLKRTVELANVEAQIIQLREEFNRLLGLTSCDIFWSVPTSLPYIPESEPSYDCLEHIAHNERLDIMAARWEVERILREFPTIEWWAYTDLYVGVSSAREPDKRSPQTTGPAFAGEIPIFNFGQAARRRVASEFRQAQFRLVSLEIEASSEVREARDRLFVFRNQVLLYTEHVLPNQQQIIDSTEKLYNIMAAGIYDLLDTKRNQLTATLNYQLALKNYWTAKSDLDKALGGKFSLRDLQ